MDRKSVVGFYDTTLFGSGKEGYIFTDSKIYYKEMLEKPKKIWYEEIINVKLGKTNQQKDCNKEIIIYLNDGSSVTLSSISLNKTPLYEFIKEIIKLNNNNKIEYQDNYDSNFDFMNLGSFNDAFESAFAGGDSLGNYNTINKVFEEEKFHASQGHGFAAERANNLYDNLTGKKATILGDSNIKNGADRLVNGIEIQSKYCSTGSKCISECFENGKMRYTINNGTKPMEIEVPSDMFDDAIKSMQNRIRKGEVPGVSDPNEAKNIVRKGHFTYNQAKNIAKAGTVESLTYDSVNGAIISSSALGVSAVLTFATSVWNGEEFDIALKSAAYAGLKVGGIAFATSVLTSQLSKAGLNSALVGSSESITSIIGPKASATLVNAFRSGTDIYGAAAMKSAAKLLRGNIIVSGVTVVLLSSADVFNIFTGRISTKQLVKNVTSTTTTVTASAGGWIGGAAVGAALGSFVPIIGNGVGAVVGGIVGSVASGGAANKITNSILDEFIEDDAKEMLNIIEKQFEKLAFDYILNQKEAEKVTDSLREILNGKKLKDMFSSEDKKAFAKNLLEPLINREVLKRKKVTLPSYSNMQCGLVDFLEELSDAM